MIDVASMQVIISRKSYEEILKKELFKDSIVIIIE
jgi:hypothetical protein